MFRALSSLGVSKPFSHLLLLSRRLHGMCLSDRTFAATTWQSSMDPLWTGDLPLRGKRHYSYQWCRIAILQTINGKKENIIGERLITEGGGRGVPIIIQFSFLIYTSRGPTSLSIDFFFLNRVIWKNETWSNIIGVILVTVSSHIPPHTPPSPPPPPHHTHPHTHTQITSFLLFSASQTTHY